MNKYVSKKLHYFFLIETNFHLQSQKWWNYVQLGKNIMYGGVFYYFDVDSSEGYYAHLMAKHNIINL